MLASMTWGQWLLAVSLIGICLFLMLVILLQRGRGVGLAGAFGGGGSGAFGAKTGDVFTWITVIVTGVFVCLAVVANYAFDESRAAAEAASEAPTVTTIPVQFNEEGEAFPIDIESVQLTPPTPPADGTEATGEKAAPAASDQPAPDQEAPQEPGEEPATP